MEVLHNTDLPRAENKSCLHDGLKETRNMTVEHVQKLTEHAVRTEHYTYFNFRYVDISPV